MAFKSRFYATAALCCLTALAPLTSAYAGQLFPPNNLADPKQSCPNGEVLSWVGGSGTVECTNPTPGITVSCPTGQVIASVTNGKPNCVPSSSAWQSVDITDNTTPFDQNCEISDLVGVPRR